MNDLADALARIRPHLPPSPPWAFYNLGWHMLGPDDWTPEWSVEWSREDGAYGRITAPTLDDLIHLIDTTVELAIAPLRK